MSNSVHATAPTDKAVSAHKVLGTWVYTPSLERLGFVQDISIDQLSGRVSSVMLRMRGALHLRHHSYPLLWELLEYSMELGGYIVDLQCQELQRMVAGRGSIKPGHG